MGFGLNGCVAVVTGASRGLGRVYARALAAAGAAVAVTGRSASHLRETVQLIEAAGGQAIPVSFDVADPDAVERAFSEIEAQLGAVDLLINNAGVSGPTGYSWDVDPDSWWRTLEIHVRGTYLCSRAVLPAMILRGGGRIINIVSHAGVFRWPTASAYSVSKAAVIKLTENLAVELKPRNIHVFAFHPGLVDGGLTHAALAEEVSTDSPAYRATKWVREQYEAGRAVPPELALDSILLLASGGADELSGRYLTVFDDLARLTATADTIRRHDLLTLRLREVAV
ncbi:MAG TPA: SDR family oxidoreductase [Bryobacteraceae bacterium]|nr:SDR family oxidoreductase [Bryobacteraceae bacterium]